MRIVVVFADQLWFIDRMVRLYDGTEDAAAECRPLL